MMYIVPRDTYTIVNIDIYSLINRIKDIFRLVHVQHIHCETVIKLRNSSLLEKRFKNVINIKCK